MPKLVVYVLQTTSTIVTPAGIFGLKAKTFLLRKRRRVTALHNKVMIKVCHLSQIIAGRLWGTRVFTGTTSSSSHHGSLLLELSIQVSNEELA
jgi:hypothetical protein